MREDITVIPADSSKKILLDGVYLEGEVILKDKDSFDIENDDNLEETKVNNRNIKLFKHSLKNFEDIKEGDKVYSTWYGGEIVDMKIKSIDKDDQTATAKLSDSCYGNLYFCSDFRQCWVCNGYTMINTEALAKVGIHE